jgi:hypothetical protein
LPQEQGARIAAAPGSTVADAVRAGSQRGKQAGIVVQSPPENEKQGRPAPGSPAFPAPRRKSRRGECLPRRDRDASFRRSWRGSFPRFAWEVRYCNAIAAAAKSSGQAGAPRPPPLAAAHEPKPEACQGRKWRGRPAAAPDPKTLLECGYFNCEDTLEKVLVSWVPNALTVAIIAIEMPPAIKPYSIAVAPD